MGENALWNIMAGITSDLRLENITIEIKISNILRQKMENLCVQVNLSSISNLSLYKFGFYEAIFSQYHITSVCNLF